MTTEDRPALEESADLEAVVEEEEEEETCYECGELIDECVCDEDDERCEECDELLDDCVCE